MKTEKEILNEYSAIYLLPPNVARKTTGFSFYVLSVRINELQQEIKKAFPKFLTRWFIK